MLVSYAGIPLHFQDPEGATRSHLQRYLDERGMSIFCKSNTAISESRFESIRTSAGSTVRRVGLPVGNYPPIPKPRINSLYWPTGAKRWAHGLFLIDGASAAAIVTACADNSGQTLVMQDDIAGGPPIQSTMYLLPPRPISPIAGIPAASQLWLLPLVDARFFWQEDYVITDYSPPDWFTAIAAIQGTSRLDVIAIDAIPAAYGCPHVLEFQRDFEQAATLIDAIGLTLQKRIVGQPAVASTAYAQYAMEGPATAAAAMIENIAASWKVIAGGDFSSVANAIGTDPQDVAVTFTKSDGTRVAGYSLSGLPTPNNRGIKIFHCAATGSQDSPVANVYVRGFEQNLANQIAVDYGDWFQYAYDVTFSSLVPWAINGFDDYVRWEFCQKGNGRKRHYVAQTRAVSMPPNFGCECLPLQPCPSSSSSSTSSSSGSSTSGSSGSTSPCPCVTVVADVACTPMGFVASYASVRGCC